MLTNEIPKYPCSTLHFEALVHGWVSLLTGGGARLVVEFDRRAGPDGWSVLVTALIGEKKNNGNSFENML